MNKNLLIPILGVAAVITAGALGVKAVRADETSNFPPIVQKLIEKFNLNEDEVQTVFNEERQEQQQQMREMKEERLNQAVEDGVITEEQKQALTNKWQEMWQEEQAEREQHREEMQAWFEEQGIDAEALQQYEGFGPKMGMHGGGRGGFGMGIGMGF